MISIITPTHMPNNEFLKDSYNGLLQQNATIKWEWLIQYDGKAWNPPDFLLNDKRIKLESNGSHLGVSITRNIALMRSSGEFVINVDADDFLLPDALKLLSSKLHSDNKIAWVLPRNFVGNPDGEHSLKKKYIDFGNIEAGSYPEFFLKNGHSPFHAAAAMFRKEHLFAYGGWPATETAEDNGLLLAVSLKYPGWYEEAPLFFRRKHAHNITSSKHYLDVQAPRDIVFVIKRLEALKRLETIN